MTMLSDGPSDPSADERRHRIVTDLSLIHLHSQLIARRERTGTPPVDGDVQRRMSAIQAAVERILAALYGR